MLPRILFLGAWFAGLTMVIGAGFMVDGYLLHVRKIPLPHPYPLEGVLWMCGFVTVEAALLYAIVAWRGRAMTWWRVALAIAVALALLILAGAGNMHQPPYSIWHVLWLGCVTLALICVPVIALLTRGLVQRAEPPAVGRPGREDALL